MKISYEFMAEDYWKFNKFAITKVPRLRNGILKQLIFMPIIFMVLNYMMNMPLWMTIVECIIFIPIFYGFLMIQLRARSLKYIKGNKAMLCEHIFEIDEEGIKGYTENTNSNYNWNTIRNLMENKEYVYLFFDEVMAVIIPKRAFSTEEEAIEFVKYSLEHIQKNK